MVQKHPICHERIRKVPKQFSWLDHRLVRDHYIDRLSHRAAALYLFLVTVADAQGLSYYSDHTLSQRIAMDENILAQTRQELIHTDLIAYKKPLYQVLSLDVAPRRSFKKSNGRLQSLGQIFKQIQEDVS